MGASTVIVTSQFKLKKILEKTILKEATRKVREKERKLNKTKKQFKKNKAHAEKFSGITGKAHARSRKHVEKNAKILCKKKVQRGKMLDVVSERLMNLATGRKRKSPQSMMARFHGRTFPCNFQLARISIVGVKKKLHLYTCLQGDALALLSVSNVDPEMPFEKMVDLYSPGQF